MVPSFFNFCLCKWSFCLKDMTSHRSAHTEVMPALYHLSSPTCLNKHSIAVHCSSSRVTAHILTTARSYRVRHRWSRPPSPVIPRHHPSSRVNAHSLPRGIGRWSAADRSQPPVTSGVISCRDNTPSRPGTRRWARHGQARGDGRPVTHGRSSLRAIGRHGMSTAGEWGGSLAAEWHGLLNSSWAECVAVRYSGSLCDSV